MMNINLLSIQHFVSYFQVSKEIQSFSNCQKERLDINSFRAETFQNCNLKAHSGETRRAAALKSNLGGQKL